MGPRGCDSCAREQSKDSCPEDQAKICGRPQRPCKTSRVAATRRPHAPLETPPGLLLAGAMPRLFCNGCTRQKPRAALSSRQLRAKPERCVCNECGLASRQRSGQTKLRMRLLASYADRAFPRNASEWQTLSSTPEWRQHVRECEVCHAHLL